MALIKCPECGKEVSDKASACIFCGCPLSEDSNSISNSLVETDKKITDTGSEGTTTTETVKKDSSLLMHCPACGELIAKDVVKCPKCGHLVKEKGFSWGGVIAFVVIAIILGAVLG